MINEVILLGRVVKKPEYRVNVNGSKEAHLILEIEKGFKDSNGKVQYDEVSVVLWKGIAEYLIELATEGSMISVKGRLVKYQYLEDNKEVTSVNEVFAEKLSLIDKYYYSK